MNDIYYIKTVDNSRLRKPVDLKIILELGSWLMVGLLVVVILLLHAWEQVQIRQIGYQIEAVRSEGDTVQQENHLLLVERAALRSPQRIDSIARASLGMTPPSQEHVVVLDATHTMGEQPVMAQVRAVDASITSKHRTVE